MEAIKILEGSEGHNEEISKIWNYVLKNWTLKDTESLHRVLTQCCNSLVLSNGYDERSTIPIALRCLNALMDAGELSLDDSFNITLNIVFRYPYRVAVMLDTENLAFDYVQELLAKTPPNGFVERLYGIVLLSCRGVCVQDNLIKPLSWITYATIRVYNMFRNLRMDHLAIAVRLLMNIPQRQGGTQLSVVAACTALIENMMNRPEVAFLKSEIEMMRKIVRSSRPINSRALLGMACLKVQHPKIIPQDDGFNLLLTTFLEIVINMKPDLEIQTHVLDSNRAIITPVYLARLVVNLSTSKSISDVIARARCIRFIHEWLRTITSIGNNPQRPFLDQTYVLSILVLDEITKNLDMDSRLAADLIRELIRLELIASNQNTESAIGQRRDDLTTRLVKYVSNSFSFVRMSRIHTSTTTLTWLRT